MIILRHYITTKGQDVYLEWLRKIRDVTARIAIDRRVQRIKQGNFGDQKYCRDGIWELRIHAGPGYRVYYAIHSKIIILLLGGGDKQTQDEDINRACEYLKEWQRRPDDERQITR